MAIYDFQISTMKLAQNAIDKIDKDKRCLSTLTMSFSDEILTIISEKLISFRNEIIDLIKMDKNKASNVYQLNVQFFPLVKTEH